MKKKSCEICANFGNTENRMGKFGLFWWNVNNINFWTDFWRIVKTFLRWKLKNYEFELILKIWCVLKAIYRRKKLVFGICNREGVQFWIQFWIRVWRKSILKKKKKWIFEGWVNFRGLYIKKGLLFENGECGDMGQKIYMCGMGQNY